MFAVVIVVLLIVVVVVLIVVLVVVLVIVRTVVVVTIIMVVVNVVLPPPQAPTMKFWNMPYLTIAASWNRAQLTKHYSVPWKQPVHIRNILNTYIEANSIAFWPKQRMEKQLWRIPKASEVPRHLPRWNHPSHLWEDGRTCGPSLSPRSRLRSFFFPACWWVTWSHPCSQLPFQRMRKLPGWPYMVETVEVMFEVTSNLEEKIDSTLHLVWKIGDALIRADHDLGNQG